MQPHAESLTRILDRRTTGTQREVLVLELHCRSLAQQWVLAQELWEADPRQSQLRALLSDLEPRFRRACDAWQGASQPPETGKQPSSWNLSTWIGMFLHSA